MTFMLKKIILTVVILLAVTVGFAEEHDQAAPAEAADAPVQVPAATQEPEPTDENTEVFVPTETISEDLSVPFPVDI